jgi:CxxC-x17-CxxC domain-containing protein
MNDKTIKCQDCGADFTWTASEQEFFQSKGYTNEPRRCVSCRQAKKNNQAPRQMYDAVCANPDCKQSFQVPFNPSGKTVFCKEHFVRQVNTDATARDNQTR